MLCSQLPPTITDPSCSSRQQS